MESNKERFDIKQGILEYEEETHTYWLNGVKCISVTQFMKLWFKDKYKGIDEKTLSNAAKRGSEIHNAIECYEKFGVERNDLIEFRNYLFLKGYYNFKVLDSEKVIVIKYRDLVVAGRLDMILEDNLGMLSICDIKTTATLDKEYLSMQLSLYKMGYIQTYGVVPINLYALHLKKDKNNFYDINEIDVSVLFDEYLREKEKENETI